MPRPWDPTKAAKDLRKAMESAIDNLIDEVKRPIDGEITGSARKAELQSIKQAAVDCRELMQERMKIDKMISDLEKGDVPDEKERAYATGFAEKFIKS